MIRSLTITDFHLLLKLKNLQWVVRRGSALNATSVVPKDQLAYFTFWTLLSERLFGHRRENIFGFIENGNIRCLTTACQRAGPTAWNVCQLAVNNDGERNHGEIFERVANYAEERGAERLFLAVPNEERFIDMANSLGFNDGVAVTTYSLMGRAPLLTYKELRSYRLRLPGDELSIYKMYNRTTPANLRRFMGITLQQWLDSEEKKTRQTQEFVMGDKYSVNVWVRLDRIRKYIRVQSMIGPDWRGTLADIVGFVLDKVEPSQIMWDIFSYQESLGLVLEGLGFQVSGGYRLMVKPLVSHVEELSRIPVGV